MKGKPVNKYLKVGYLALFVFLIFQFLEGIALEFFYPLELFYYWLTYAYVCFNICFQYLLQLNIKEARAERDKYLINKHRYDKIIECLKLLNVSINNIILKDDVILTTDNVVKSTSSACYYLTNYTDFPNTDTFNDIISRLHVNLAWYARYIDEGKSEEEIKKVGEYICVDVKYFINALYSCNIVYEN